MENEGVGGVRTMSRQSSKDVQEVWRDVPGFDGRYQVSNKGRARRIYPKSGTVRMKQPYQRQRREKSANRKMLLIKMTYPDGRTVERPLLKVVAETFCEIPDGMLVVHRNGFHLDNSLDNVAFISRKGAGHIYGRMSARRRPVCKVNSSSQVVEVYASARAAGKANHMSYQTILDRCNNKIKNPFALDGFNYQWDEGVTEIEEPV